MQISDWMKDRETRGTMAELARRNVLKGHKCIDLEKCMRQLYALEAVIAADGSYERAAETIGVCRHTIGRLLRSAGITAEDVRAAVQATKVAQ